MNFGDPNFDPFVSLNKFVVHQAVTDAVTRELLMVAASQIYSDIIFQEQMMEAFFAAGTDDETRQNLHQNLANAYEIHNRLQDRLKGSN